MIFKIDGGDGDQSFFDQSYLVESCHESWFDGNIPRGKAILLKAMSGKHAGTYMAVTSRTTDSIEDQLAMRGMASVVLHILKATGSEFRSDLDTTQAVGMTVLEQLDRRS